MHYINQKITYMSAVLFKECFYEQFVSKLENLKRKAIWKEIISAFREYRMLSG